MTLSTRRCSRLTTRRSSMVRSLSLFPPLSHDRSTDSVRFFCPSLQSTSTLPFLELDSGLWNPSPPSSPSPSISKSATIDSFDTTSPSTRESFVLFSSLSFSLSSFSLSLSTDPDFLRSFVPFLVSHSGRKLTWLWHVSKTEIRTRYLGTSYILMTSMYQMAVLVQFNTADAFTYKELQTATSMADGTLKPVMAMLVKSKVLNLVHEDGEDNYELNYSEFLDSYLVLVARRTQLISFLRPCSLRACLLSQATSRRRFASLSSSSLSRLKSDLFSPSSRSQRSESTSTSR